MTKPNNKALGDFFGGVAAHKQLKQAQEEARLEAERAEREARRRAQEEETARERAVFPDYFESVAPVVEALEKLPPRDGREFYIRVDLNPNGWDCNTNVRGPEIGLWALYTNKAGDEAREACPPQVHGLAIDDKGAAGDERKRIDLEINELPVLRVRSKPQANGNIKIEAHHYTLDYACTGRKTAGSGSYVSGPDGNMYREREWITDRRDVADLRDLAGVIGTWVSEVAPERLDDVRKVLEGADPASLEEKIPLLKPLRLKTGQP